MTNKIVVFISGNGSNLQRVIDKIADKTLDYKIMIVVSNKKKK